MENEPNEEVIEEPEELEPASEATPEQEPVEDGASKAFDKAFEEAEEKPEEEAVEEPEAQLEVEKDQEEAPEEKPEEPSEPDEKSVDEEIKHYALKDQAAERFRELSKRPRMEQAQEWQEKAQLADQMLEAWSSVNANADQVQAAQGLIGAINSDNPDQWMQAARALREQVAELEKRAGISEDLDGFPDLKQKVSEMELSAEDAREIAKSRTLEAQREQYAQRQAESQQERLQRQQAESQGLEAINELEAAIRERDADFEQKLPYLMPSLKTIRQTLPPDQWVDAVIEAYQSLPAIPTTPKAPVGRVSGQTSPTTGLERKPKSAEDAFDLAMGRKI